jgi:hypothetical protein
MADKYWIATGAATTANTAGNWNTAADGTGSTGVPATNDTVIFGHDDTFAADLGTAPCTWDLALTLTRFQTLSNFNAIAINAATDVQFVASSKSIIFTDFDPVALGFKPGMAITTSGSISNNGQDIIASVNNTTIVTVGALTDEAIGASVTIIYDPYVDLQAHISTTRLDLDCHLKNTSGSNKNINLSGTYPASSTYVFNGVNAQVSNGNHISYVYDSSANGAARMLFDNGPYGNVVLGGSSAYYSPASGVPIVNNSPSSFYSLNIASGTFFNPDPSTVSPRNDSKKYFIIESTSAFTMACNKFDAGLSTFEFVLDGVAFEFPVTGSATYGAADNTFIADWCHVIISTAAGGRKATIPADRTLAVNSLVIGPDAVLEGLTTADTHKTSTVLSISRPKIEGAWNFSQMGDGIYVSLINDAYPVTPSDGPVGRVQLSNDGGTFTSNSALTYTSATGVLSSTKFQGDGSLLTNLPGGGGGSGTVTSVAVSGSDGIEVDSGSPITTSGTIALGVNKTNMLSHLNVTDGATPTNTANVTAAGALMDSEVTNLAQVKAFDETDYATAAQGTTANNALPKAGGTMSGNITMAGSQTVDGRDLSVDGAKLDTIDTNADVTDATNVTAAGALMDSEVTNLAQVKAFDSADYATAAQGTTANNALPKSGGAMTGAITTNSTFDGRDVAVDGTKLDGISAGADVALPVANNNTTLINTNTANIAAITTKAKMSVYLSSNASYTSGATIIPHDLIMWDTGGNFDPISNCFIAPRDGHYLVTCSYYSTVAPSWSFSLIYVDDLSGAGFAIRLRRESSNDRDNMISGIIQLGAGHKVAHYAYRSSSSGDIGAALNTLTYFQVTEMV